MRLASTEIEAIRKSRVVPLSPEAAFDLFTARLDTWWPLGRHSIGQEGAASVRFEGQVGGRVVEVLDDGAEHSWADVLAWDPPHRFVIAWHPSVEPDAASIVEVRFSAEGDGTRLELEHRGWEEFGDDDGKRLRDEYDVGWEPVLGGYEAAAG